MLRADDLFALQRKREREFYSERSEKLNMPLSFVRDHWREAGR